MAQPANTPASPDQDAAGGFFPPDDAASTGTGLLSPAPSHASSARRRLAGDLPQPRRTPLRPGSAKEDLVRRYASERLLHISRRFVKKFGQPAPGDTVVGYRSMGELCRDVDALLNNLWKSGTPSLQVQSLLGLASEFVTWMDGFPSSPRATLAVLRKLDYCFASLLAGEDLETQAPLPGFEHQSGSTGHGARRAAGFSRTDMVRLRSLAEQTRVAVVDVFRRGPPDPLDEGGRTTAAADTSGGDEPPTDQDEEMDDDDNDNDDDAGDEDEDEDTQMGVARVYEYTLVKLGELLGDGYGRIGEFEPSLPLGDNDDDEY